MLAVAAGRLSDSPGRGDPLIDPFGELIYLAYESGGRYDSVPKALMADVAQKRLRQVLTDCEFVALGVGPESNYRWSRETQAQFRTDFEPIAASPGTNDTLWRKRRSR